jgi:hypothetical protein
MPFKIGAVWAVLFPVGFFMGIPFPAGLKILGEVHPGSRRLGPWPWRSAPSLERDVVPQGRLDGTTGSPVGLHGDLIPWAWAVNGCFSVLAPLLAGMMAMAAGFRWVLWTGAGIYFLAFLIASSLPLRSEGQRSQTPSVQP